MKEILEFYAEIINVYPLGASDTLIIFQTVDESWILRGVIKDKSPKEIEPLVGKSIKITFEMADGRELVSVQKIEIIES